MEFTAISDIKETEFKNVIKLMVGNDIDYQFLTGEIEQSYHCKPLRISVIPRNGYLKVVTGLENGWPFLQHVIAKNKLTAMTIRYLEGNLAEFKYWRDGSLLRMQHALKDTKWVWYGQGELQPWENPSCYRERLVKNRLTAKMLELYLQSCGYSEVVT
jgi:hypothetical protein